MAICDNDVSFAYSFCNFVNENPGGYFFSEVFTEVELLADYVNEKRIDIIMVAEELINRLPDKKMKNVIILTKKKEVSRDLGDNIIYKYQSAKQILKEVMNIYGNLSESKIKVVNKKCQIIGIYSPIKRIYKTSFALTLGQIMAQNSRCLYINTENYSGFEDLLNKEYKNDLSDVMYYLRQENVNFAAKLEGIVNSVNGLNYIPPVSSIGSLREVKENEWEHLLEELRTSSIYENVIIDFDDNVNGLINILNECDKVYMPVRDDYISKSKIYQFEKNIEILGNKDMNSIIEKIEIPDLMDMGTKESYIHELTWGELGKFTRGLLSESRG